MTIIGETIHNNSNYYVCKCDCGKEKLINPGNFLRTKSCGCLFEDRKKSVMIGDDFGRLIIKDKWWDAKKRTTWCKCLCGCGKETIVAKHHLTDKSTLSCGCLQSQLTSIRISLPVGEGSFNLFYKRYKSEAKIRHLNFELSKDQFRNITSQDCFYCGKSPTERFGTKDRFNGSYLGNGIDRIDNSIGYVLNNCVPSCKTCNYAKGQMSLDKFYEWLERIYTHSILSVKLKKRA